MPIAALPDYLVNRDLRDASPGMRFGMYLSLWGVNQRTKVNLWKKYDIDYEVRGQNSTEREVRKENKVSALSSASLLNTRDLHTMRALLQRQDKTFAASVDDAQGLVLQALATAPFTTGLGNEHPLENGFAFFNPHGLPYLPGSGVKGVLRQAARELASGEWGSTHAWETEKLISLTNGDKITELSLIDALFGLETSDGQAQHVRGALTFWDVIPQIKGNSLLVEIMTPHQSHYYQKKCDDKSGNSITPHDSGQPSPINFLTVPPGSGFTFYVRCDLKRLNLIAPKLANDDNWKFLLASAFEHSFQWLGFGAKTAVGYGAMQEDPEVKKREAARREAQAELIRREREESIRQAKLAQMSPIDREICEFLYARQDKNQSELSALFSALQNGYWPHETKAVVADRVRLMMQDVKKWKEKSEKKNPDKDRDYQDTVRVMAWIKGQ